jgi:penicillin-insensitive murein endopeptidase
MSARWLACCAWLLCACSGTPNAGRSPQANNGTAMPAAHPSAETTGRVPAGPIEHSAVAAPTTAPAAEPTPAAPPPPDPVAELLALGGDHSTSLGAPGNGSLLGGVALPDSGPGFSHNVKRPTEARYGTVELVQAIVRSAAVVEHELPGSGLVVNDIGLEHGGKIAQHGSHENGRDADILFYVLDKDRKPLPSVGVPIEPNGSGYDYKDLHDPNDDVLVRLDAPRTWRFVQAMIEDRGDQLQRIFLVEHVRSMLLAEAQKVHAPKLAIERFEAVTCQPGQPHDDHMHVRLFCTPEDMSKGCLDKPPIYAWHKEALAALGLQPILETVKNRTQRNAEVEERTTSRPEARASSGPMSHEVRRFLARRESWAKQPHPGREYCK